MAALERSITTGEGKPTEQSYVVAKELAERLEALKARLNQALATNLSQVNAALEEKGIDRVK